MNTLLWALTLLALAVCATGVLFWIADEPDEWDRPRGVRRAR